MPAPVANEAISSSDALGRDPRLISHRAFRDGLVDGLRRQLFGPAPDDDEEIRAELLVVSPLQLYATGILFPQKSVQSLLEDNQGAEGGHGTDEVGGDLNDPAVVRQGKRSRGLSADEGAVSDQSEPLNLANEYSPSACGISFRLKRPAKLTAVVTFGTYAASKHVERRERAGEIGMDGRVIPETREVPAYRRTHHSHVVPVIVASVFGKQPPIQICPADPEIKLHVTVRPGDCDSLIVSTMVVNHRSAGAALPANSDCYFQVAIEVREEKNEPVFLPIDRESGDHDEAEMASLELLYRHRRAFALGHGAAGDWNTAEMMSERGRTDRVSSAALPTYELQPIKAREQGFGERPLELSMAFLTEGEGTQPEKSILTALRSIVADYLLWIEHIESSLAAGLPAKLMDAARNNLACCRRCYDRMLEGINVLQAEPQAMLAFRLMNRAMLVQQFHSSLDDRRLGSSRVDPPKDYRGLPRGKGNWRPFQLAFVLMNVAGMTRPEHPERRLVDLIWFPTGGGKTEAYLGLAAFTICLERLRGALPGVTVLMRYTLRLLTAQQFQRASSLILALELIRRTRYLDADLGKDEISIGLWVGEGLSPNRRADAKRALNKLKKREKFVTNPFQVLTCPWCAVELDNPDKLGYVSVPSRDSTDRTVRFRCPDQCCAFGDDMGMPILVVDDEIYAAPPTLLIGTVDKFAQIAWRDEAGRLFGLRTGAPPPSLVIQDELHLISGPLGTIVGLYETAIDRMCTRDGHVHKVVASTATIRRSAQQCRDLYDRDSFEFPPQAVRAGESYFAYEDHEAPGRRYVGFLGSAVKSHQTALVRACAPLLQFANVPLSETDEAGQAIVDPYGTLVWYFNSLRELGHAATLSVGDIPEFIKGLRHRLGIKYQDSRYIREIVELTSRCEADEIPEILKQLKVQWRRNPKGKPPVDVLLATNMIAVGVDVPRLGLLIMSGQPKSTAEYIQATSRVGRNVPGLVVTVYTQTKSRDRSHYERFVAYHQSLYRHVEPTSVTPFSPQARERGMRGILIALARQLAGIQSPREIDECEEAIEEEVAAILRRIRSIDDKEFEASAAEIDEWLTFWRQYRPAHYGPMGGNVLDSTLAYPFGGHPHEVFQRDAWPVPTSMRNVDGTSEALVLNVYGLAADDFEEA